MMLATFVFPATVLCFFLLSTMVSCTSNSDQDLATAIDPVGSLTIQNLELTSIAQDDLKTIQNCVALAFQVPTVHDSNVVEATIVTKNRAKTPNASLRRGLISFSWLFDIFILILNDYGNCITHHIDDDMLFLRRLSSASAMSDDICGCLQSSDHLAFSALKPDDCSLELKED